MQDLLCAIPAPKPAHAEKLTELVESVWQEHGISQSEYEAASEVTEALSKLFHSKIHKSCFVRMYGSRESFCGLKSCNLNLELVYPEDLDEKSNGQRSHAIALMKSFNVLKKAGYENVQEDFTAKWPNVNFLAGSEPRFHCVLSVRNELAYNVSQLLKTYTSISRALKKLAVTIRYWAKLCGFDDYTAGGFPPYVFDIMLIHFLQQRTPPILPVLHELVSENASDNATSFNPENYPSDPHIIEQKFNSSTEHVGSMGELLVGFFRYYCGGDGTVHATSVVQIVRRKVVSRDEKRWNKKRLGVEDPFMPNKNLAAVNVSVFDYFIHCLQLTYCYFAIPQLQTGPLLEYRARKLIIRDISKDSVADDSGKSSPDIISKLMCQLGHDEQENQNEAETAAPESERPDKSDANNLDKQTGDAEPMEVPNEDQPLTKESNSAAHEMHSEETHGTSPTHASAEVIQDAFMENTILHLQSLKLYAAKGFQSRVLQTGKFSDCSHVLPCEKEKCYSRESLIAIGTKVPQRPAIGKEKATKKTQKMKETLPTRISTSSSGQKSDDDIGGEIAAVTNGVATGLKICEKNEGFCRLITKDERLNAFVDIEDEFHGTKTVLDGETDRINSLGECDGGLPLNRLISHDHELFALEAADGGEPEEWPAMEKSDKSEADEDDLSLSAPNHEKSACVFELEEEEEIYEEQQRKDRKGILASSKSSFRDLSASEDFEMVVISFMKDLLEIVERNAEIESCESRASEVERRLSELTKEDLIFDFEPKHFVGNRRPVVICSACHSTRHTLKKCPDMALPVIRKLRPMSYAHTNLLNLLFDFMFNAYKQSPERIQFQENFRKELEGLLQQQWPSARLTLFGSSCNGFGFTQSDIDMCIEFDNEEDKPAEGHETRVIGKLAKTIRKFPRHFKEVRAVTRAKVPIVKFHLYNYDTECDISLYNTLALRNTKLLQKYVEIDRRFQQLGYIAKIFAKYCDIGDASRGSLSSYAYIIMVIYYLQRTDPPILPVLQEIVPEGVDNNDGRYMVDNWNTYFLEDLEHLPKEFSVRAAQNLMTVSQLWIGFLRFYVEQFDYQSTVISIRQTASLHKFEKLWTDRRLCIEDPFNLDHNLSNGLSKRKPRQRLVVIVVGAHLSQQSLKVQSTLETFLLIPDVFTYIWRAIMRAREVFGFSLPENQLAQFYNYSMRDFEAYFFGSKLRMGRPPPRDRTCKLCGHVGHFVEQCPWKKSNRKKAVAEGRDPDVTAADAVELLSSSEDDSGDEENAGFQELDPNLFSSLHKLVFDPATGRIGPRPTNPIRQEQGGPHVPYGYFDPHNIGTSPRHVQPTAQTPYGYFDASSQRSLPRMPNLSPLIQSPLQQFARAPTDAGRGKGSRGAQQQRSKHVRAPHSADQFRLYNSGAGGAPVPTHQPAIFYNSQFAPFPRQNPISVDDIRQFPALSSERQPGTSLPTSTNLCPGVKQLFAEQQKQRNIKQSPAWPNQQQEQAPQEFSRMSGGGYLPHNTSVAPVIYGSPAYLRHVSAPSHSSQPMPTSLSSPQRMGWNFQEQVWRPVSSAQFENSLNLNGHPPPGSGGRAGRHGHSQPLRKHR